MLFGELYIAGQVVAKGENGILAGTAFTAAGADFAAAGVDAGYVIYIENQSGSVCGAYEIVSVDGQDELTISVLRKDSTSLPIPPGNSEDLAYRIVTYQPQIQEVSQVLAGKFGLRPAVPNAQYSADDIFDSPMLTTAATLSAITAILATLLKSGNDDDMRQKYLFYASLAAKATERCVVCIDAGNDEIIELVVHGGSVRLARD